MFGLMRITSAPVHADSGCMYQLHSTYAANMTFWKHAQVICMCTKPCVVRICCTGLCKQVSHGAPNSLCRKSSAYALVPAWGAPGTGEENGSYNCKEQMEYMCMDLFAE